MPTPMYDIALQTLPDGTQDLLTNNGDFAIAESTQEHQRQLLLNDKGSYKENPSICVGLFNYLDDEEMLQDLASDAAIEFARDGMKVDAVTISNLKITIDAYYP